MNVKDEYKDLNVNELKELYLQNSDKNAVLCLNLTGEFNIGSIVRTASLFSMGKIIILGKRTYDKRTTVGMENYIPVERIRATIGAHDEKLDLPYVNKLINEYKKKYQVIFVEQGGIDLREIQTLTNKSSYLSLSNPVMFVLGSESEGIPQELLKGEKIVSIPQKGIGRSFNVGHAFAMIAYAYYYY